MAELGHFCLCLALCLAAYAVFSDLLSARYRQPALRQSAANATSACWLCLTLAAAALMISLARCDFRLDYVARYTSLSLPVPYRISAFWAGAAGSLLLWLWMQLSLTVLLWRRSNNQSPFIALARAITNIVAFFFLLVLLLDKDPFAASALAPPDGTGLNPLLQHPAMVLHPPTLFIGYAAYSIPCAWAVAVLAFPATATAPSFLHQARNFSLVAWLFLTIGNALGSWWAYQELGWGGFWSWDPVENSSLMPWLAGAALLHAFKKYRPHSSAAAWVIALSVITYSLCIFGTFLTRYGLVSSIHAFAEPGWGILFLILLIVIWLITATLLITNRRNRLPIRTDDPATPASPATCATNTGILTCTNCIFMALVLVIMLGTLFPFLTRIVSAHQITLQPKFFTKITAPGGLAILMLLGVCPQFSRHGFTKNWRTPAAIVAALAALATWFLWRNLTVPCFIISAYAAISILTEFLAQQHRWLNWCGPRLAHLGVILVFVAIAAQGYAIERQLALAPNESIQVGPYKLHYTDLTFTTGPNYQLAAANILVSTDATQLAPCSPALALYHTGQTTSEIDLRSTLADDLYIALTALDRQTQIINLRVLVKPLINWLWIGAALMAAGAFITLISRTNRNHLSGWHAFAQLKHVCQRCHLAPEAGIQTNKHNVVTDSKKKT